MKGQSRAQLAASLRPYHLSRDDANSDYGPFNDEKVSSMTPLEGKSEHEIAELLAAELKAAPMVNFSFDAQSAFHLVGLLQLACRHPNIKPHDVELAAKIAKQVSEIGPVVAEVIAWGWDKRNDQRDRRK